MINDDTLEAIARELQGNTIAYEHGKIKYITYANTVDNIFANYGVSKKVFYAKLNNRTKRN